jgi:hypothetical protein
MAKKKKAVSRKRVSSVPVSTGFDNKSFLIIVAGGFILIVILMLSFGFFGWNRFGTSVEPVDVPQGVVLEEDMYK